MSSVAQIVSSPSTKSSPQGLNGSEEVLDSDVSNLMFRRAINDYGILHDIRKNGDVAECPELRAFWCSLANIVRDDHILGLKTILDIRNSPMIAGLSDSQQQFTGCETVPLSWPDPVISSRSLISYRNEKREYVQTLCSWDLDNEENKILLELNAKREFTRAAMICVFNLKIKQAVDILLKAADQVKDQGTLRMAAITISAFNADRYNSMPKTQRNNMYMQLQDPYLRTIFGFLTAEGEEYKSVLGENGIPICDRLAFACKYLNDTSLDNFVRNMIQHAINTGDINGLLLTGESNEGINLLQSYLDKTHDVQTVSLIAIRFFKQEFLSEYRTQHWIQAYFNLLDIWGLWEKRAELSIKMENIRIPSKSTRSVFLLCSFCGKSISVALEEEMKVRNASSSFNKLSSCPNCRKPMPRCSLCLLHMGTTTGVPTQNAFGSLGWQSKPFLKWFSWCQTCRHGGHTDHINQWFSENTKCPVTTCNCKCLSLDLMVPKSAKDPL